MRKLDIPALHPLFDMGEGGHHTDDGDAHQGAAHHLHLLHAERPAGHVPFRLRHPKDSIRVLARRREEPRGRRGGHALVARPDDEVGAERFAVDGHDPDRVGPVDEDRDVVLVGDLYDPRDVVDVSELVVDVVDEEQRGCARELTDHRLDLLCSGVRGDMIQLILRDLARDPARRLDRHELRIVGKRRHDDRVALRDKRGGDRLEPPARSRHHPHRIHVQPCREVRVELRDGRVPDVVEPGRVPAVIADRVAVAERYCRLHGIGGESPARLDGIDVDVQLLDVAGIDIDCALHRISSSSMMAICRFTFSMEVAARFFCASSRSCCGAVSRSRNRMSERMKSA